MAIGESVAAMVIAAVVSLTASGAAVSVVRATDTTRSVSPSRGWQWPLAPQPDVERGFDPPDQPWLPGHRGVDLRARVGQSVLAPTAGRVTFSGLLAGRGVVVVTHRNGLRSTFEPVASGLPVGRSVTTRQRVAEVAEVAGHCAPTVCLHWGVRRGLAYLDPLSLLGRGPVVLLPLR